MTRYRTVRRGASLLVLLAGLATPSFAGMLDTPLPTFSNGKAALRVGLIPTFVRKANLESHVICTNLGAVPASIGLQVFDESGVLVNTMLPGDGEDPNVAVGQTISFGMSDSEVITEDQIISVDPNNTLANGSARVVASTRGVFCTALLVDTLHAVAEDTSAPPTLVRVPVWTCGNSILDPLEICDDGNTLDGDSCSADCQEALEPPGGAGEQSKAQQKCIVEANKNLAKVAKAIGKNLSNCIKNGSKGKIQKLGAGGTIDTCKLDDPRARVGAAKSKLDAKVLAKCLEAPGFGTNAPGGVPDRVALKATGDRTLQLAEAIFGSSLDATIVVRDKESDQSSGTNTKGEGKCQAEIMKRAAKCLDTKWKVYNKCKKNTLKGKIGPKATSAAALEACVAVVSTDVKVITTCGLKTEVKMAKKCNVIFANVLPGHPIANTADIATLIDVSAECVFCLQANEADGLDVNCDLFDDATANGSCVGGS